MAQEKEIKVKELHGDGAENNAAGALVDIE